MGGRCFRRADPERLAKIVVQKNLSVRETERLAQQPDAEPRAKPERKAREERGSRVVEKELPTCSG